MTRNSGGRDSNSTAHDDDDDLPESLLPISPTLRGPHASQTRDERDPSQQTHTPTSAPSTSHREQGGLAGLFRSICAFFPGSSNLSSASQMPPNSPVSNCNSTKPALAALPQPTMVAPNGAVLKRAKMVSPHVPAVASQASPPRVHASTTRSIAPTNIETAKEMTEAATTAPQQRSPLREWASQLTDRIDKVLLSTSSPVSAEHSTHTIADSSPNLVTQASTHVDTLALRSSASSTLSSTDPSQSSSTDSVALRNRLLESAQLRGDAILIDDSDSETESTDVDPAPKPRTKPTPTQLSLANTYGNGRPTYFLDSQDDDDDAFLVDPGIGRNSSSTTCAHTAVSTTSTLPIATQPQSRRGSGFQRSAAPSGPCSEPVLISEGGEPRRQRQRRKSQLKLNLKFGDDDHDHGAMRGGWSHRPHLQADIHPQPARQAHASIKMEPSMSATAPGNADYGMSSLSYTVSNNQWRASINRVHNIRGNSAAHTTGSGDASDSDDELPIILHSATTSPTAATTTATTTATSRATISSTSAALPATTMEASRAAPPTLQLESTTPRTSPTLLSASAPAPRAAPVPSTAMAVPTRNVNLNTQPEDGSRGSVHGQELVHMPEDTDACWQEPLDWETCAAPSEHSVPSTIPCLDDKALLSPTPSPRRKGTKQSPSQHAGKGSMPPSSNGASARQNKQTLDMWVFHKRTPASSRSQTSALSSQNAVCDRVALSSRLPGMHSQTMCNSSVFGGAPVSQRLKGNEFRCDGAENALPAYRSVMGKQSSENTHLPSMTAYPVLANDPLPASDEAKGLDAGIIARERLYANALGRKMMEDNLYWCSTSWRHALRGVASQFHDEAAQVVASTSLEAYVQHASVAAAGFLHIITEAKAAEQLGKIRAGHFVPHCAQLLLRWRTSPREANAFIRAMLLDTSSPRNLDFLGLVVGAAYFINPCRDHLIEALSSGLIATFSPSSDTKCGGDDDKTNNNSSCSSSDNSGSSSSSASQLPPCMRASITTVLCRLEPDALRVDVIRHILIKAMVIPAAVVSEMKNAGVDVKAQVTTRGLEQFYFKLDPPSNNLGEWQLYLELLSVLISTVKRRCQKLHYSTAALEKRVVKNLAGKANAERCFLHLNIITQFAGK